MSTGRRLPARVCPVCGTTFEPKIDNAPGSLIYCRSRCAWNTDRTRSVESLQAERDALTWALEEMGRS